VVLGFGVRVAELYIGLGYQAACVSAGAFGDVADHMCYRLDLYMPCRAKGYVSWLAFVVQAHGLAAFAECGGEIVPGTLLPGNLQANTVRRVVVFVISV
jgi:hypothetical protein